MLLKMAYMWAFEHIYTHGDREKERESCPVLTFRISLMTSATIVMEDTTNAARLTSSILLNISM
jgi:hypothetical protein